MQTRATFEVIFSPFARIFAPVALVASALLPPEGIGFDLCWIHRLLGVPCPGCGLTRSFTNLTQGHLEQAVLYHPFGPVLYLVFVIAAVYAVLPKRVRERVLARATARESGWRHGYRVFLVAFFGFGVLRALAHHVTGAPF